MLLLANVVVVVEQVVEEGDVGRADARSTSSPPAPDWRASCRTACEGRACWPPDRASPLAERPSRSGAGPPRSGCSGQSSSRENSSQSSIARSGSSSRIRRGVSSCRAAVRTLIFMNFGSKERGAMASPYFENCVADGIDEGRAPVNGHTLPVQRSRCGGPKPGWNTAYRRIPLPVGYTAFLWRKVGVPGDERAPGASPPPWWP